MPRKPLFKDPVRFSINLERALVERLDEISERLGIERNRLINRLLEKYIHDPNPFSQTTTEAAQMIETMQAAEDPAPYGEEASTSPQTIKAQPGHRLPANTDPIPGAQQTG